MLINQNAIFYFSQIHASLVDFWEQRYGIDQLRTMHDSNQYPPSIEMTIYQLQPSNNILPVHFEGCAAEYAPQFEFYLPAGWSIKLILSVLQNLIHTIIICTTQWDSSLNCSMLIHLCLVLLDHPKVMTETSDSAIKVIITSMQLQAQVLQILYNLPR